MRDLLGLISLIFGIISIMVGLTYLPYGLEAFLSGKLFVPSVVGFGIFIAFGILLLIISFLALREN